MANSSQLNKSFFIQYHIELTTLKSKLSWNQSIFPVSSLTPTLTPNTLIIDTVTLPFSSGTFILSLEQILPVKWHFFWYPFASDHNHCAMLSFIISLYYKHCSSFCGTTSIPLPPWAKERMRKLGCLTHSLTSFILCLKHKVQAF